MTESAHLSNIRALREAGFLITPPSRKVTEVSRQTPRHVVQSRFWGYLQVTCLFISWVYLPSFRVVSMITRRFLFTFYISFVTLSHELLWQFATSLAVSIVLHVAKWVVSFLLISLFVGIWTISGIFNKLLNCLYSGGSSEQVITAFSVDNTAPFP